MIKRATIKDIADKAGVSIGTVHCALAGKPGVGAANRTRILRIARECSYRPNTVAASLKRKTVRLAAVFPGPDAENRFYFSYVWDGVRDYLASMRDYNIELVEYPYYNDDAGQAPRLAELLDGNRPDGLLTIGYMNGECRTLLRRLKKAGVPVVLVGSDVAPGDRLCCVQPDYDIVGRTVAELIAWQAPKGDLLVCAGSATTPAHYQIVLGLEAFHADRGRKRRIVKIHESGDPAEFAGELRRALLRKPAVGACFSVNARSSVLLARTLEETGRAGAMPAIGCDVFAENIRALEKGVFTNLLHKNPYSQAFMASKCLAEFLLHGSRPAKQTLLVGSEIVFQSSLPMFRSGQQTLHAVVG